MNYMVLMKKIVSLTIIAVETGKSRSSFIIATVTKKISLTDMFFQWKNWIDWLEKNFTASKMCILSKRAQN